MPTDDKGREILANASDLGICGREPLSPHAHLPHTSSVDYQTRQSRRERNEDLAVDLKAAGVGIRHEPPIETGEQERLLCAAHRWARVWSDHGAASRWVLAAYVEAVVDVIVEKPGHDDLASIGLREDSFVDCNTAGTGAEGRPTGFLGCSRCSRWLRRRSRR